MRSDQWKKGDLVFKGKEGGLVVDCIEIAAELKNALAIYTQAKGKGEMTLKAEQALEILLEKVDVPRGLFHGFDYSEFKTKSQTRNKEGLHSAAR